MKKRRQSVLDNCVENIAQNVSVLASIKVIKKIIDSLSLSFTMSTEETNPAACARIPCAGEEHNSNRYGEYPAI